MSILRELGIVGDVVLSGPPCAGKTTMKEALRELGFSTTTEVAAELITNGISPVDNWDGFYRRLAAVQDEVEAALRRTGFPGVLDRGFYDAIAYHLFYGKPVPQYLLDTKARSYVLALVFEPLPWAENGVRFESDDFQHRILPFFEQVYMERGVRVLRVPAMPHVERLRFVLQAFCEYVPRFTMPPRLALTR